MKGKYITVDGDRQTGKSVLIQSLAARALELGYEVVVVEEPSETEVSADLRATVRKHSSKLSDISQALIYTACRRQILEELVLPALEAGKIVISERSAISTAAYQGDSLHQGQVELLTDLVLPEGMQYDLGFVLLPQSSPESDPVRLSMLTQACSESSLRGFQSSYVHQRFYRIIHPLNAAHSAEAVHQEAIEVLERFLAE